MTTALVIGVPDPRLRGSQAPGHRARRPALAGGRGSQAHEVVCGVARVAVYVLAEDPRAHARGGSGRAAPAAVETLLAAAPDRSTRPRCHGGRLVTIPCAFDGPDLDEVAALAAARPTRW